MALSQGDSRVKEPSQTELPHSETYFIFYMGEYELEVMNSIGIDEVIHGC